jgi:putative ABC transport system ATP-binding protein
VAICRALINDPTIVFGDEPTGALDSTAAQEIMGILEELNADGMTMLLVTHDPRVASHGDRVIYMIDGRIAAELELDREEHLRERQAAVDTWLATLR